MSIAHELSCDVAAAMLAARAGEQTEPASEPDLTSIILEVHATLRRLTRESRRGRLRAEFFPADVTPRAHQIPSRGFRLPS